jgi:hypothetical protein
MPLRFIFLLAPAVLFSSLGVGCRQAASSAAPPPASKPVSAATLQPLLSKATGPSRCSLLTDQEIEAAIGPHNPGTNDLNNEWGMQSCRWTATTIHKDGSIDSIEVAQFSKEMQSWAREQAKGDPIDGFGEGAAFDASYGELWFRCAHDGLCVVKARMLSGTNREQIARRLAHLVLGRLE